MRPRAAISRFVPDRSRLGFIVMQVVRYIGSLFHCPDENIELHSPSIDINTPELDLNVNYQLAISKGAVTLTCKTNRYDASMRVPLYMRGLHFTRACTALATFSMGLGMVVIYSKVVEPDGREIPLGFINKMAPALCKSYSLATDFNMIFTLGLTHVEMLYVLMDLSETVNEPISPALNGTRAIERIRNSIAGEKTPEKRAWPLLHQALRVDEAYVKFITNYSTAPRHGKQYMHDPSIHKEISSRCWIIADRYIEYLKRNKQPLPESEFPLLTG